MGGNSFLGRFEFGEIHRRFVEFSQNSSVSNTHDSGPPGFRTQQTKQVGLSGFIQRCRCLVKKHVFRPNTKVSAGMTSPWSRFFAHEPAAYVSAKSAFALADLDNEGTDENNGPIPSKRVG